MLPLADTFAVVGKWSNENQGVVTIAIFFFTILGGWVSGIFSALRRRPKFKVTLIPGPTFCCTFPIGKKYGAYDMHRTAIALYLQVTNIGSAASSIENVSVGYHWHLKPFSMVWLKNTLGWGWLTEQAVILDEFQVKIGENTKLYPFLTQMSHLSGLSAQTFLEVGRSTNGVVYFEQPDGWGGCFPTIRNGSVRLKVKIRDAFGKSHSAKFTVSAVWLEDARKYNPAFGKTFAQLHQEPLPFDVPH